MENENLSGAKPRTESARGIVLVKSTNSHRHVTRLPVFPMDLFHLATILTYLKNQHYEAA